MNTKITFNNKSCKYGSMLVCYSLTDTRNNRHPGWKHCRYWEAKRIKGGKLIHYKQKNCRLH